MATTATPAPDASKPNLAHYKNKMKDWRRWQSFFAWTHIILQGGSVVLGVIIAANVKTKFLPENLTLVFACTAAFLGFLSGFVRGESKAAAYQTAAREIEKALAPYEGNDPVTTSSSLTQAEQRGIDILNKLN